MQKKKEATNSIYSKYEFTFLNPLTISILICKKIVKTFFFAFAQHASHFRSLKKKNYFQFYSGPISSFLIMQNIDNKENSKSNNKKIRFMRNERFYTLKFYVKEKEKKLE